MLKQIIKQADAGSRQQEMESGNWEVENGRWKMGAGKMGGCKWAGTEVGAPPRTPRAGLSFLR